MNSRKKHVLGNVLMFLLLFFVSLYRQLSIRYLPEDPYRTYILYTCYLFLLSVWAYAIISRLTQRNMKMFLLAEDLCMFLGLTTRFVQDTFIQNNIWLLRVTGLFIASLMLPLMILGLFASMCIGRENGYRIPLRWYLILLPAIVLCPLILTDNYHHFFTVIIPEESQPNLTYHPNVGFFLVFTLILVFAAARVYQIYKRNNLMDQRPVLRQIIPFIEVILLILFFTPYIINWMQVNAPIAPLEIIEQYAGLYYIEVLTWEIFIYLGLVPVNMDYREIFERSTLGLQIICDNGEHMISHNAKREAAQDLSKELWEEKFAANSGRELQIHRIPGAEVIWTKDVSELQIITDELNKRAEMLAQEGILLSREMETKNVELKLSAQSHIYDILTKEVKKQLDMIHEICQMNTDFENTKNFLRQLMILGTFVKRRCNLRLTELESGKIEPIDFYFSFQEMAAALENVGIKTSLLWNESNTASSSLSMAAFDILEYILEQLHFIAEKVEISIGEKPREISLTLTCAGMPQNISFPDLDSVQTVYSCLSNETAVILREKEA